MAHLNYKPLELESQEHDKLRKKVGHPNQLL